MNQKKLFFILAFSFLFKVILAYLLPVYADEAYYFAWVLHPQLSYLDHPPMVSWLIAMGEFFLPLKNALSLRFFFIIASTVTLYIWSCILKRKNFSAQGILAVLILFLLNPLLGPGSVIATPDVPLVLFWSLSYYFFLDVIEKKSWSAYGLLGVSLGLGFCAKYHIVLFVLGGLIYLVISKKYKELIPKKIIATLLLGFLFCLPVVIWNSQHEWISFTFQLKHGFGRVHYDWTWTASFILGQILILNPVLLAPLLKKREDRADQVLGLFPFFFFLISSFKAVVEANWPIATHMHGAAYAVPTMTSKKLNWAYAYWIFMYVVFGIIVLTPLSDELFKNQISSLQLKPVERVVKMYKPLYGPTYQVSALLTWMTRDEVFKLRDLSRYDFYDTLPGSLPVTKEFYVLKNRESMWPEAYQNYKFTLIESFEKQNLELFRALHE